MRRQRNAVLLPVAALGLGAAAAVLAGELLLRITVDAPRSFPAVGLFQSDERVGYRMTPNFAGSYLKSGVRFSVRTNAAGFRDPRDFDAPAPGVRRILALGDSYVFGMPVEATQTFVAVLERELNARAADAPWQVLNLGVPSYGTRQEARLLERWAPTLRPDRVLLGFCLENDLHDNEFPPDMPSHRAHRGIQVTPAAAQAALGPLGEIRFWLRLQLSRLALHDFVRYRVTALGQRLGWTRSEAPPAESPESWSATLRALDELVAHARAGDLDLTVLLLPEMHAVLDASARDFARKRLFRHLVERGVRVLDPTDSLRAEPDPALLFERHGTHLSVAGNDHIGRFLADALLRDGRTGPTR